MLHLDVLVVTTTRAGPLLVTVGLSWDRVEADAATTSQPAEEMTMQRLMTLAVLAAMLVLLLPGTALAASPRVVDPGSLTPALNPDFTWSCFDTGRGPICQGTFEVTYENEQIDMVCDGRPVYVTGSGSERMTRWHTPDGRATKTIVNLSYPADRLTLSPTGDGPSVIVRGHWNRHYNYPIPGDASARVLTEVGAVYVATAPGQGLVFHDAGLIRFTAGGAFEDIDVIHGPHDLYADFEAVQYAICSLLG